MTGRLAAIKFITILTLFLAVFSLTESAFSKPTYGIAFGYVPGYKSSTGSYSMSVADIPWSDLSHVSFFVVTITGTTPVFSDPLALHSALLAQAHSQSPKVRCYLTVGGATQTTWPTTTANCITLADNIANLMKTNGFDGVDMDCEFPGQTTGGTFPGTTAFSAMMDELKSDLTSYGSNTTCPPTYTGESQYGLTMYLSPGYAVCGYDFTHLNNDVDWYTLSGYDLNIGTTIDYQGSLVAPNSELFTDCLTPGDQMIRDITAVGNWYNSTGSSGGTGTGSNTVAYSNMILGMPMYGRDNVDSGNPQNPGISDNDAFLNGTAGTYDTSRCEIPYTESGNSYGMDNDQSYCAKINWSVGQMGMKGIAVFDLGQGLQSGGPSNSTLVNIWSAIGGGNGCVTVGTNPCAPAVCTNTPTYTATPGCGFLVDNFESGSAENSLGGYCSTSAGGCAINPASFLPSAGYGLDGSTYGARFYGTNSGCTYGPEFLCPLQPTGSTNYYNAASKGENAVEFTMKINTGAASGPCTVYFGAELGQCQNGDYQTTVVCPAASVGTEIHYTVLLSSLLKNYDSCSPALPALIDTTQLYQLYWIPDWSGAYDITVDDIYFLCAPTATPTNTMTASNTPTRTPTAQNTSTYTPTQSATSTATNTVTNTATSTPTVTNSGTDTSTITPSATQTNTSTPLADTATSTLTSTYTSTPLANTSTSTSTYTSTPMANTSTSTSTSTPLADTATSTDTPLSTNTQTSTSTVTPTSTDTNGPTNTSTPTGLATNTSTSTDTPQGPTSTSTNTSTSTSTGTFTPTMTNTALPNTATSTNTPTISSTGTNTPTITFTPTYTATITPTALTRVIFWPPYPNPVSTGPIQINVASPVAANATLDVFTTAFRKIYSTTVAVPAANNFTPVPGQTGVTSAAIQWDIRDRMGINVADGLYYLRVSVAGTVKIYKILVLR